VLTCTSTSDSLEQFVNEQQTKKPSEGFEKQGHIIVLSKEKWIKIYSINGSINQKIREKVEFVKEVKGRI